MLKKSSFQRKFQEMGTVLIDILRGKSEDEISDYVLDFKKSMVKKDTKVLCKIRTSKESFQISCKR